ncbi:MAG: hypothetical protein Q8K86_07260 [Candidatus Nanopelagicaceae bacterium]|nr:hypothetical protein [Candidatus Nanopelagicaceae bacterium]
MGRRQESGFFETLIKSWTGCGTTTHYSKDWLGHKTKTVVHHDSGKTKKYTHGTGIFGHGTNVEVTKKGRTVQKGYVGKGLLGGKYEQLEHTDGSGRSSTKEFNVGLLAKKDKLTTYDAQGKEDGHGEGQKGRSVYEGKCWTCDGTGTFKPTDKPCRKCKGTGIFRKER